MQKFLYKMMPKGGVSVAHIETRPVPQSHARFETETQNETEPRYGTEMIDLLRHRSETEEQQVWVSLVLGLNADRLFVTFTSEQELRNHGYRDCKDYSYIDLHKKVYDKTKEDTLYLANTLQDIPYLYWEAVEFLGEEGIYLRISRDVW